jgi:hypothetical protein
VAIEGIDAKPVARAGDISAGGIYFETDREVGKVGTVQWLHVASPDGERSVHVMAYVVRNVTLNDVGVSPRSGVAFEFMPESDEAQEALRAFVLYVLAYRGEEPVLASRLPAHASVGSRTPASATVQSVSVRSMTLETSWAVATGEHVRIDILAPGMTRRIRLDGRAVGVTPVETKGSQRFKIDVEVHAESRRPLRRLSSMTFTAVTPERAVRVAEATPAPAAPLSDWDEAAASSAIDDLLAALVLPPAASEPAHRKREHLSGDLARVRLSTLCSLMDMERMSGVLTLTREGKMARIYVSEGELVDVEPVPDGLTPRAAVGQLLAWDDGAFEFSLEESTRPNRIGLSTTALLLDLARESDEARRA